MSSADLRALRAELGALRIRVEAQEERIAEQEERIERLEAEKGEQASVLSEIGARSSEPAYSFVSSAPAASERDTQTVEKEDVEGRLRLARACGAFFEEGAFRRFSRRIGARQAPSVVSPVRDLSRSLRHQIDTTKDYNYLG